MHTNYTVAVLMKGCFISALSSLCLSRLTPGRQFRYVTVTDSHGHSFESRTITVFFCVPSSTSGQPGASRRAPYIHPMADSFAPNIAPQTDGSGNAPEQAQQQPPDAPEPVPITEQEVGEYREQDRYLPVSSSHTFPPSLTSHQRNVAPSPSPICPLFSSFSFLVKSAFWPHRRCRCRSPRQKKDCKCFAYHEERRAANG